MKLLTIALFLILQTVHVTIAAREVAGVNMPEQITIAGEASPLQLNGAGIREKFFFDIYVAALYLPDKTSSVSQLLEMPGTKRIVMHFLYDEVGKSKLTDGWTEGFRDNHTESEFEALKPRLGRFNALFNTVVQGDLIRFDYLPEKGTEVWENDKLLGTVPGEDFHQALLKVWLGEKPADATLKDALLGMD